jgi:ribonuclease HI
MLFTDGFKDPGSERTGAGVYNSEFGVQICRRLTDELSTHSVELLAIVVALQWVGDVQPIRIIVCSDSLSVLKSLSSGKSNMNDLLLEVLMLLWRIETEK